MFWNTKPGPPNPRPEPLQRPQADEPTTKAGNTLMPIEDWPNLIITTDEWFCGPDGVLYKAVYGPVDIITAKALLGFDPKNSTNWFVAVGTPGNQLILMGCRIHYAMMCPVKPVTMNNILDLSEGNE